jgi:predicted N-formylglutamate amidohydrolase
VVICGFSRLLIDPNRGLDDPTLIMKLSDGAIVPGNASITPEERALRIEQYYRPYHAAVSEVLATRPRRCAIVSIHSFTPAWKGVPRPWHVAILWAHDRRLAGTVLEMLRADPALVVGENEPYAGGLEGDTLDTHAPQHRARAGGSAPGPDRDTGRRSGVGAPACGYPAGRG